MDDAEETLRRRLEAAHGEALKVGDSPLRADRVAADVQVIANGLGEVGLDDERHARIRGHLDNALRVLRRDDDGREAAKHLSAALGLLKPRTPRPSPFD